MSDTRPPTPDATKAFGDAATPAEKPPEADKPEKKEGDVAEVKKRRVPGVKGAPRAAKHSMADLLVGTVLAERYRLVKRVGEGAMGWVFLAEHVDIKKKFAVKVLRPSLCRITEAVSRFKREARAASAIGSQHIVDVTDFGTTDTGAAFFVMENLDGEDLASTLSREKKLPWERVRKILLQLCDALQAAHDAGIFHRDVKPANFYRVKRGDNEDFVKVLDFGIARLANPNDSIVTQTGVVMGTPDFMAPEQAQGRHVDHRADIYSLGATAYALLTGRPPFVGKNEYDVIYKQLNEEPKPPIDLAKDLPQWANDVLLKAMRKNPDERYQSMREFSEALKEPAAKVEPAASASASASGSASGRTRDEAIHSTSVSAMKKKPASGGVPAYVWILAFVGLAVVSGLVFAFVAK